MTTLRRLRLRGEIPTQKEVARLIGVHAAAVSKWELGISKPRTDKLPLLAKLYGCSIEELLTDEDTNDSDSAVANSSGDC